MGLDNGIVVKKIGGQEEKLCYWRKWWGPRNDIVDYLCDKYDTMENSEWTLDTEDIANIIDILSQWKDENIWNAYDASPVWEYDDIKEKLEKDIMTLITFLIDFQIEKAKGNNIEVYFYDSY